MADFSACGPVYSFSFQLPRKRGNTSNQNHEKNKSSFNMKEFVSSKSYPCISINISSHIQFLDENNKFHSYQKKCKDKRGTFRTRNKFIMARNLLCKIVKHEKALLSTEISKVVSMVWKGCCKSFQDYFEYLSILETRWYDHLQSSHNSSIVRYADVSVKSSLVPYHSICSSSYSLPHKGACKSTKSPLASKFKIQKIAHMKLKHKIDLADPSISSLDKRNAYRINRWSITSNFGIVTEDMFLKL